MNYLKCDSCKQYNLLTSEYLVFCHHCSRKLHNNFADWNTRYPQLDFACFITRMTVTAEQIADSRSLWERLKVNVRQGWAKHHRRLVIIGLLIVGVGIILSAIFGKRLVFNLLYPKVAAAWQDMSWQEATIGRQAITISTPVKLSVHDTPLSPELQASVTYSKCHRNEGRNNGIDIAVLLYTCKSSMINNLDATTNHALDPLSRLTYGSDITGLTTRVQKVTVSGLTGCVQEGTYRYKNAITLAYKHLVLVREQHMWQVNLVFRADDEPASAVAEMMLHSVKIR